MDKLFTNALIHETSPYLLQHAHNPVQWHAWNEETLSLARSSGKPIILSIGYSACHWCHVMEHESFEDETVASYMNKHFTNIKVDREERPDIDHLYMDAVQLMAGNGGWPLNVFLTPDARPFYGGTYFPPKQAFNRPSWMQVLTSIKEAWETKQHELESQADNLVDHLKSKTGILQEQHSPLKNLASMGEVFTREDCVDIAANLLKNADTIEGGFGKAPKFPQTFSILYLLQHSYFFGNREALEHAELSLNKMLSGGIYDHLGGGFARYSTDEIWLAPHFEKMLYDNALLITALAEAALLTGKKVYKNTIEETVAFLNSSLHDSNGGYYAALDADSEGVEGKYYVWSFQEIQDLLGDDAAFFSAYFNVVPGGNWEHQNILHVKDSLENVAGRFGMEVEVAGNKVESLKKRLLEIRGQRIAPGTDNKIILGWNALLVNALCKAYRACKVESYKEQAVELYTFLFERFQLSGDGSFNHCLTMGKLSQPAFLDDYAYLAEAAIALQEITGTSRFLLDALSIMEFAENNFKDEDGGLYYYTSSVQDDVLVRKQEIYDGALPSSNAIIARNFLYMGRIFGREKWVISAQNWLEKVKPLALKYPGSFACWALEIQKEAAGVNEIVITGEDPKTTLGEVLEIYFPNVVLQSAKKEENGFQLLQNKSYIRKTFIYVCRHQACLQPIDTINGLIDVIKSTLFNKIDGNI